MGGPVALKLLQRAVRTQQLRGGSDFEFDGWSSKLCDCSLAFLACTQTSAHNSGNNELGECCHGVSKHCWRVGKKANGAEGGGRMVVLQ